MEKTTAKDVIETATPSVMVADKEVGMGDMCMFRQDDEDKSLRGLPGHVRGVRDGKLDIYVGSSLRVAVDPRRVQKIVKKA